jgi:hypothetical protein
VEEERWSGRKEMEYRRKRDIVEEREMEWKKERRSGKGEMEWKKEGQSGIEWIKRDESWKEER